MRAVALLRGINVGRGRRLAMADLRTAVAAGDLTTRNWNTVQKLHAAMGGKT